MTLHAYLYDAAGTDREVDLSEVDLATLDDNLLLWIDLDGCTPAEASAIARALTLPPGACVVGDPANEPALDNYGQYFRFAVDAAPRHGDPAAGDGSYSFADPADGADQSKPAEGGRIAFIVGKRWLVTAHDRPIAFLAGFRDQDKAETLIGLLSPQSLAASLLDWHLGGYFEEVSRIETAVDRMDERVLRETASRGLLGRMVAMRRRVSKLRTLLVRQRHIFYGLSRPDFALVADAGAAPFYEALERRFERAVDELERTRDLVTGSFELFTSRSSQQTNDLVKVLTFLTAVIGFCAAVAGLLGMNFELAIFRTGLRGFLVVTGSLIFVAIAAMIHARRRAWI